MIEALWVMTYFKISLPTRNWDIAFLLANRHQRLLMGCNMQKQSGTIRATGPPFLNIQLQCDQLTSTQWLPIVLTQ